MIALCKHSTFCITTETSIQLCSKVKKEHDLKKAYYLTFSDNTVISDYTFQKLSGKLLKLY